MLVVLTAPKVRGVTILASDWEANSVRQIDTDTSTSRTFVPSSAGLQGPSGIVRGPDGSLFVGSAWNHIVRRFDAQTGQPLGSFASNAQTPLGLTFGPDQNLYVASRDGGILRYDGRTGDFIDQFAATSSIDLWWAFDLEFGPAGDLFVSSFDRSKVLRFNGLTGAFIGTFATAAVSVSVTGLTFGPDGDLYLAGYGNGVIYRFDGTTGQALGTFAQGLATPTDLHFGPDGMLYVSSQRQPLIYALDPVSGNILATYATGGATGSGSDSFIFIPEPTALFMMIGSGIVVLSRRRRFVSMAPMVAPAFRH